MRGETMKDKSKKSTYSTTFGVDPERIEDFASDLALTRKICPKNAYLRPMQDDSATCGTKKAQ